MASSSSASNGNGNGEPPMAFPPTTALGESPPSGSPRSASISLQAAATMNASLQREPTRQPSSGSLRHRQSPSTGRRRSTVLMNLQLNDPTVPPPGEMIGSESPRASFRASSPQPLTGSGSPLLGHTADPHHQRTSSLGELHQELEAEQEAQVNRLLQMIRQQQLQLQQLQAQHGQNPGAADESAIVSERSATAGTTSQPGSAPQSAHPFGTSNSAAGSSFSRSPAMPMHPRSSFDMARADLQRRSRTPSRGASPRLRATSIGGESATAIGDQQHWVLGSRDESAFYQAETQMLVRENQMLRHRIRDLERQLSDLNSTSQITHEPASHSHLLRAQSADEEAAGRDTTPSPGTIVVLPVLEAAKEG